MYTFEKITTNKQKYLLFYDYETFGIDPALDKPSQFSCIRTDMSFNIVSKPEVLYCYPPYDYLPNPDAILLTGITPNYTLLKGLNEFDFAKKINSIFSIGNTCILGYNNIHFDDEITRNIFYRNLLDPYHWSWKNGNSRWDLLNVLRTYYALRPKGIIWPRNKNNVVTFKLDVISQANGIKHNAHDATSDVYATIELMKLLQRTEPQLLNFLFKYRVKKRIIKLISITGMKPIFYISSSFGAEHYNIGLISPILWHPRNSNILISIDLTKNILLFLEDININNIFSIGIKLIYINKCPVLIPYSSLTENELLRIGIDYKYCYNNLLLLRSKYIFIKNKIISIFSAYNYVKYDNVDLQLYESFFSQNDQIAIKQIHNNFPISSDILKKYKFYDKRIEKIIFFCKARNFITYLNKYEKKLWFQYCIKKCNMTELNNYRYNINFLIKKHIKNKKNVFLLKDILNYVNYLENSILHIK